MDRPDQYPEGACMQASRSGKSSVRGADFHAETHGTETSPSNMRKSSLHLLYRMPPVAFRHTVGEVIGSLAGSAEDVCEGGRMLGFDSARSALCFALRILSRKRPGRGYVVVPAWTCWSVAAAVEHAGLRAVFCDVDPYTLDFVPESLTQALDDQTLAVVATHLLGARPSMAAIADSGISCVIIEDASQAMNGALPPDPLADLRITSLGRGKPMSAAGGGLLEIPNEEMASEIERAWRDLPAPGVYGNLVAAMRAFACGALGQPNLFWVAARLPGAKVGVTEYPASIHPAGITRWQMNAQSRVRARLADTLEVRRRNAEFYGSAVGSRLTTRQPAVTREHGYAPYRFPAYLDRPIHVLPADDLRMAAAVGVTPMYPGAVPDSDAAARFHGQPLQDVPGARWVAQRLVTLPTHAGIGPREREEALTALGRLNGGDGNGRSR